MPANGASGGSPRTRSDEGSNSSARMTHIVREEMGDTWRHDPKFFKRFFPINMTIKGKIPDIQAKLYNFSKKRWTGIDATFTSVSPLSTKLLHLMNGMLENELKKTRKFFKTTKPRKVYTGRKTVTTPSIFLAGAGPEFANTGTDLPFAQYAQGVAPFEVRLQSSYNAQGHGRLAVHAREMFIDQENRRFLFGVVLTQHTMTVCMFDRAGTLFSDPLDYHANPAQFCAVVYGLATKEAMSIGFDMTICREGRSATIRTAQSDGRRRTRSETKLQEGGTVYKLKTRLFHTRVLIGKGTICWRVLNDLTKQEYVIKDCWISPEELPGRESEAELLWHVQRQGLTRGVAQIRHYEEVHQGEQKVSDTIMRNRRLYSRANRSIERVHTRLVFATYGKTFDEFSSRRELLLAFHDAVLAHRDLFEKAGILHRDISVRNILINPDGDEGDRGILIDLDSAIRISDSSPYSTQPHIGTWPYKSRNVLEGGPHTYLDDLESFYYVLCFIAVGYAGPFTPVAPRPDVLTAWEGKFAKGVKHGDMSEPTINLPVSDWFGEPFRTLCAKLHSFFESRTWNALKARAAGRDPPVQVPSDDYEEFITYIRTAISSLEANGTTYSEALSIRPQSARRTPEDKGSDASTSDKPKRTRLPVQRLPPIMRPRRNIADYR